jgi:GTP 3',8-cyclase
MSNDLRIDNHKLMFHVGRVNQWLRGKNVFPIYVEISPSGACNHRCLFCAFDYLKYKPRFIDTDKIMKTLKEMGKCGIKSVNYSGEGEPFMHKDMVDIILETKKEGMNAAVAINGVLFTKEKAEKCLSALTWVKVSLNAGTKESYARIHGCSENDFRKVLQNLSDLIAIRKKQGLKTTIGAQMLLLPENQKEPVILAKTLKNIGVDYLVIKPFIKHPMSSNEISGKFKYSKIRQLEDKLELINDSNFKVIFRAHAMDKLESGSRLYKRCYGLPFFTEIISNGDVYTCGPYLGNKKYCYGNIYENTFKEIWFGKRRKNILKYVENRLDVSKCMKNCRLDEINRYLWEIKHPAAHVNYI